MAAEYKSEKAFETKALHREDEGVLKKQYPSMPLATGRQHLGSWDVVIVVNLTQIIQEMSKHYPNSNGTMYRTYRMLQSYPYLESASTRSMQPSTLVKPSTSSPTRSFGSTIQRP